MNKTALTRSIPYWLLLVLSIAAVAVGGWLVWDKTNTMEITLLDGTATNVEVYVGQAWITAGAAILAAGVIGILLALVLAAAKALIPAATPVVVEPIDWTADDDTLTAPSADPVVEEPTAEEDSDDQNGSSGSTATATKISVK
ncbi:tetraspanin family protein [Microbacterium aerolatum]|nr:tetraspanin family protein [Microbacterium aerolatum]